MTCECRTGHPRLTCNVAEWWDQCRTQRRSVAENGLDHEEVGADLPARAPGPNLDLEPVALRHALREFEKFYNAHRPHQCIANARPLYPLPTLIADPDEIDRLDIRRCDRLGGILHVWGSRSRPVPLTWVIDTARLAGNDRAPCRCVCST
jgi:hypothetical protein